MKLFVAVAVLAGLLFAQGSGTRISMQQIQPPNQEGLLAVQLVNGRYEVHVLSATAPNAIYDVTPTRQANGTWLLPQAPLNGVVVLHVNGSYLRRGADYTVSGAIITCAAGQAACLSPTAILAASYSF